MKIKQHTLYMLLATLLAITSCAVHQDTGQTGIIKEDNRLLATLYNAYAAEYKALAYQAFNIGKERLQEIRKENPENTKMAVVVDIDETILNNTPYESRMMLENKNYSSETWTEWCNLAVAEPVPGALEFLRYADSLGFHIFYITNRKKQFVEQSTIANVQKAGFPQTTAEHFLLRDGESSKVARREFVSEHYDIVLLAGDNLGDLYHDSELFTERERMMLRHKDDFGKKFLVLPNAMYGSWLSSIGLPGNTHTIDSLLLEITKRYNK